MLIQKRIRVATTAPMDAVVFCSGRIREARVPSPPFPQGSLSVLSRTRPSLQGPHAASPSLSSPRSICLIFLIFEKAPEARLLHLLPGFCFHKNSMFLYFLLKSAANAVLKLMSAVIAIALVLSVSLKSLYVCIVLLEYSFGRSNYDSTTPPMSGSLRTQLLDHLFLLLNHILFK